MSTFPFEISNPGVGFEGELTSGEVDFITALVGLSYVEGDVLYYNGTSLTNLAIGTNGQVLAVNSGATAPEWVNAGAGDVTAASSFGTDNILIRSDGTTKGVQASGISIDDSDNVTGVTSLVIDSTAGLDVTPGSDTDADLITVNVTGTPKISWDESSDGFRINGSTGVVLGSAGDLTHTIAGSTVTSQLEIHSEGTGDLGGLAVHRHTDNNNFGGHLLFFRSDGSHATPTAVNNNDTLGRFIGLGYDGTDYETAAEIRFRIDGTPSNNNMPGDIAFFTNGGSQTLTERMTLTAVGDLNMAASSDIQFGGTAILSDSAGAMTLSNVDALDATTEATIEAAIDTLANLTSIQGHTVTLAGDFITSGANSLTLTTTGATDVTLPTTGTLTTLTGTETLSGKTLTAPKIVDTGFIADANGNEQIVFQTTTSAVNELEITNAAAGGAPQIAATGGDTDIDLVLVAKGAGIVRGHLRRFMVRLKDSATALTTGTTVGGDYRIANNAITVVGVGAYVDTAAATGSNILTVDINDSGTTIMTTNKITIDVGEKTSTTAATAPALTDTSIAADAIITFDIDQVNETTPATGLVVWIDYYDN